MKNGGEKITAPQAPVTDEELDQMIWKLERDGGMTPKLLSLMKELREVRKAKGEPVAYTDERNLGYIDRGRETAYLWGKQNSETGDVPLYRHAQQPVVPATLPCSVELKPGLIIGKGCKTETLLTALRRRADYNADIDAMTPEERAELDASIKAFKAMLAASPQELK